MADVIEKMFYFSGSKKRALLGFLHQPVTTCHSTGIIFCHPFAEEKNTSHSVVAKTARSLAIRGYPVIRFDMSGCGDSEGELDEVSIEDWQEDLEIAVQCLKNETGVTEYALWGLRFGAGLALLHAAKRNDISFIINWQPVVDFTLYIKRFLRSKFSLDIIEKRNSGPSVSSLVAQINEKGKLIVLGYPVTKNLYQSFIDISDKPSQFIPACPTLLLSISLMKKPTISLQNYFEFLKVNGASVQLKQINAEPFWDRYWRWECNEATQATLNWVGKLTEGVTLD